MTCILSIKTFCLAFNAFPELCAFTLGNATELLQDDTANQQNHEGLLVQNSKVSLTRRWWQRPQATDRLCGTLAREVASPTRKNPHSRGAWSAKRLALDSDQVVRSKARAGVRRAKPLRGLRSVYQANLSADRWLAGQAMGTGWHGPFQHGLDEPRRLAVRQAIRPPDRLLILRTFRREGPCADAPDAEQSEVFRKVPGDVTGAGHGLSDANAGLAKPSPQWRRDNPSQIGREHQ